MGGWDRRPSVPQLGRDRRRGLADAGRATFAARVWGRIRAGTGRAAVQSGIAGRANRRGIHEIPPDPPRRAGPDRRRDGIVSAVRMARDEYGTAGGYADRDGIVLPFDPPGVAFR